MMLATLYLAVKITAVWNRAQIQCRAFRRVYSNLPYINLDFQKEGAVCKYLVLDYMALVSKDDNNKKMQRWRKSFWRCTVHFFKIILLEYEF